MRIKRNILIRQQDSNDCAPACLAMVSYYYGKTIDLYYLKDIMNTQRHGTVLTDLVDAAKNIGFICKPIRVDNESFQSGFTLPAIAQVLDKSGMNHFVVIKGIYKNKIVYLDPAKGKCVCEINSFFEYFTGLLILLKPDVDTFKKNNEGTANGTVFKRFISLLKPHKLLFSFVILASMIITITGIVSSFYSQILFDDVIPNGLRNKLIVFTILFLSLGLMQIIITFARSQLAIYVSQKMDVSLVLNYFKHIYNLPLKFFSTKRTGDIITRFSDSMVIKTVLTNLVLTVFLDLIFAAITGIILFKLSKELFLAISVLTILNIILVYLFKAPFKKYNLRQMQQAAKLNSSIVESINAISYIKSTSQEISIMERIEKDFISTLKTDFKVQYLDNLHGTLTSILMLFGNFVVLSLGALMVINGQMTIGILLTFTMLATFFMEPISRLVNMQLEIQEADISMKRLSEIMDYEDEDLQNTTKEEFISLNETIQFNDISFGYRVNKKIVNNFNLEVKRGENIAIVGVSGSGKSTLAKLLLGLYEVQDGNILLDGLNINDYNLSTIRQRVGYVQQDVQLLPGSVYENLTLGTTNITIKNIQKTFDMLGIPNFIQSLEYGYESPIEESGVGLSGGEKQILNLVRCLIKEPELIILDEATSNMDPIKEKIVMEKLYQNFPRHTFIIIAHDLALIESCDNIIVMDKGVSIEQGTHQELLSNKGEYFNLYTSRNRPIIAHKETEVEKSSEKQNTLKDILEY